MVFLVQVRLLNCAEGVNWKPYETQHSPYFFSFKSFYCEEQKSFKLAFRLLLTM